MAGVVCFLFMFFFTVQGVSAHPLDLISESAGLQNVQATSELKEIRGILEEAQNLQELCQYPVKALYARKKEEEQVIRTVMASLQWWGLQLSSKAIGQYAKQSDFSLDEYKKLVENITGNFCSPAMTVMSQKKLKDDLLFAYLDKNLLPQYLTSTPSFLTNTEWTQKRQEQEFKTSIELFKSFCSWGGDIKKPRLLIHFLKNPLIMSFLFRQMAGLEILWNEEALAFKLVPIKKSVEVFCNDLLCQPRGEKKLLKQTPQAAGSLSFYQDLKMLYCSKISQVFNSMTIETEPHIEKWLAEIRPESAGVLNNQMVALMTGWAQPLFTVERFMQLSQVIKNILTEEVKKKTDPIVLNYLKILPLEEKIHLRKVPSAFLPVEKKYLEGLVFDVDYGEMDASLYYTGKLSVINPLKMSKSFLLWLASQSDGFYMLSSEEQIKIKAQVSEQIMDQLIVMQRSFKVPITAEALGEEIAKNLIELLRQDKKILELQSTATLLEIPLEFRYGLFALKAMWNNERK